MTPDDPRHGSHNGYNRGCRESCCVRAQARYMNLWRMGRAPKLIDPTGTQRRIQALYALGWTSAAIGQRCGRAREWARMISRSPSVTETTAALIAAAYDEMCMTLPQGGYAERSRRMAREKGWSPPLAWDDDTIDDPAATPRGTVAHDKADVDPIVVDRVLAGDRVPANYAEKVEITRQWQAAGRSLAELERLTGWNAMRYVERRAS